MPNSNNNINNSKKDRNSHKKDTDSKQSSNHPHNHNHQHSHNHEGVHIHPIVENMKIAFFLNLFFTIIEFIGGIMTNSMAIISDAIHDLGDTVAIGGSLYFEKYSQKGRDTKYSYGYKRFSPLAALINSIILLLGSAIILYEAIPRLFSPSSVHAEGMFYIAVFGVIVNGFAAYKLSKGSNNLNSKAIMLHLMEDVLGWVAVLIGSIIIFYTELYIIDPIMSILIAVYILINASKNLNQIFKIFLQATPHDTNLEEAIAELKQIPKVIGVHDPHSWTLDGNYNILTLHIEIKNELNQADLINIKSLASEIIENHNFQHYTLELEFENETCSFGNC